MSIQDKFNRANVIYKITKDIDLGGETLTIPEGCTLDFQGGSFSNGRVDINFGLIEPQSTFCFKDVIVENIGNTFIDFLWFKYTDNIVPVEMFSSIANKIVDFNNSIIHVKETINIYDNVNWKNITLYAPKIILSNNKVILTSNCSKTNNVITINENITQDIKGYVIAIKTGKQVAYDSRWSNGSPTLFKGITSIVKTFENTKITIVDDIEDFNSSYTNINPDNTEETSENNSVLTIYKPNNIILDNCRFVCTEFNNGVSGGLSIGRAVNINIDNCIVESENMIGAAALLSITNSVVGHIKKSIIKDSYYANTSTSYGIQLNGSTRISILNCNISNHRRCVDFSGDYETRYCDVTSCNLVSNLDGVYASIVGGHSTSFKNIIKNNHINGKHQVAIQLRGEREIVDGNIITGSYKGSIIASGYKTSIVNNSYISEGGWESPNYCIDTVINIDDNYINLINNNLTLRGFLFVSDSVTFLNCKNNTLNYVGVSSTTNQGIIIGNYKGVFLNNIITGITKEVVPFVNTRNIICDNGIYSVQFYKWNGGISVLPEDDANKITINKAIARYDNSKRYSEYDKVVVELDFEVKEALSNSLSFKISSDQYLKNLFYQFADKESNDFITKGLVKINNEDKTSSIMCRSDFDMFYIGYESYNGRLPAGTYKLTMLF